MANHQRARKGLCDSDTEDELLREQEAFLSKGKTPAARVARVAAKGPNEALSGTSADHVPLGPEHGEDDLFNSTLEESIAESILGDVVERDMPCSELHALEIGKPLQHFPRATHRRQQQFGFARRRNPDGPPRGESFLSAMPPTDSQAPQTTGTSTHLGPCTPDVHVERGGERPQTEAEEIASANQRRLNNMTPEEVENAHQEVLERLPAGVIDFLRHRRTAKARGAEDNRGARPAAHGVSPVTAGSASALRGGEAGLPDRQANASQEPCGNSSAGSQGPLSPRMPQPVAAPGRPGKGLMAECVLFDLEGRPVGFMEGAAILDAHRGAEAALLRDPIREVEAGGAISGYTMEEAAALARSSLPAQRVAACRLLAAVLRQARPPARCLRQDGTWAARPLGDPCETVDWTHVWDTAVVSQDITSVLRVALDDTNSQVIAAAATALHALLIPSAEETQVQSMADLCPLTGWPTLPIRYLERPHHLGAWVEFPLVPQVPQSEDEEVVTSRTVAAADPLSGLLQMAVLERICYVIFTARIAGAVHPLLAVLALIARGGRDYCYAIFNCPGIVDGLFWVLDEPQYVKLQESMWKGFQRARLEALQVLRLLCESHQELATDIAGRGGVRILQAHLARRPQTSVTGVGGGLPAPVDRRCLDVPLTTEAILMWRAFSQHDIPICTLDEMYPLICTYLQPPNWRDAGPDDLLLATHVYLLATSLLGLPAGRDPFLSEECAGSTAKQLLQALTGSHPESLGSLTTQLMSGMAADDRASHLAAVAAMLGFLKAYMERWGQSMAGAIYGLVAAVEFDADANSRKGSLLSLLLSIPWFDAEGTSALSTSHMASSELLTVFVLLHLKAPHLMADGGPLVQNINQDLSSKAVASATRQSNMTRMTHQHASLMQARLPPLLLLATCLEACNQSGYPASLPYADAGLAALALLPPGCELLGLRFLTCVLRHRPLLEWLRTSANSRLQGLQESGSRWAWLATHSPALTDEESSLPLLPDSGEMSNVLFTAYASVWLGLIPEDAMEVFGPKQETMETTLQPSGSRLPCPAVWQLADVAVPRGTSPTAPAVLRSLSRIVEEEEIGMREQQFDVATEAALTMCLGMEAAGSSFLQGIDPGVKAGALLNLLFSDLSCLHSEPTRWCACALLQLYCTVGTLLFPTVPGDFVRRWLHVFATSSYGDPLLGMGVMLLLLPAVPAEIQESALSVLVEEHCLHLLPTELDFPLPLTTYLEQPCPSKVLAIYADLARNNAFDKGIASACVLPRIVAGQLAMEVCKGVSQESRNAEVLLRSLVRSCSSSFLDLLLGTGASYIQSCPNDLATLARKACADEPKLLAKLVGMGCWRV